jgi:carotenoid cleavage dioxygenase
MSALDLNRGATAPVYDEVDIERLPVTGTIPLELNGTLVRNGPNPLNGRFAGNDVLHWWPEAAMLHAIAFEHGRAVRYRNRWLRTRRWASMHAPHDAGSLPDTNPNVNVLRHAGETLALAEGGAPLAITPDLDTLGPAKKHSGLAGGSTAHPKVDPRTGELMMFRAAWDRPWLRYGVSRSDGTPAHEVQIDMPAPSMMHDMAITQRYSLLFDLNVAYDFSMLAGGHRMPLRWHDERQARIGVIPRYGDAVQWFEVAPCFVLHIVNAYEADVSTIVVDVVRYSAFLKLDASGRAFEDNPVGVLWRYTLDLAGGTVRETQLGDLGVELPRINDAHTGIAHRFAYAVEQPTNVEIRGVVQYDFESGSVARHVVPAGDQNSEPIFVPRPGARSEDDGWVLVCVYRRESDSSEVRILDARDIATNAVATIHLPRRIPAGFHGAWLPANN